MIQTKEYFKFLFVFLITLTTLTDCKLNLSVLTPPILKSHFNTGLEFKEIINGHRLQSFDDKIHIHMLRDQNGSGCKRFDIDDVSQFLFFSQIQLKLIIFVTLLAKRQKRNIKTSWSDVVGFRRVLLEHQDPLCTVGWSVSVANQIH